MQKKESPDFRLPEGVDRIVLMWGRGSGSGGLIFDIRGMGNAKERVSRF